MNPPPVLFVPLWRPPSESASAVPPRATQSVRLTSGRGREGPPPGLCKASVSRWGGGEGPPPRGAFDARNLPSRVEGTPLPWRLPASVSCIGDPLP